MAAWRNAVRMAATAVGCLLVVVTTTGCGFMDRFRGTSPARAAERMESTSADTRVRGINEMVDRKFGKAPPYTTRYEQIARTDSDYLVRATAIRALNRSRDASATGLFITALGDPNAKVRLEGAKALVRLPDERAVGPLLSLLNNPDEEKDVRIAAAHALGSYKQLQVARSLAATLNGRDFGLAWQSRWSLRRMLKTDLRYDETAWLEYFTGPSRPFG